MTAHHQDSGESTDADDTRRPQTQLCNSGSECFYGLCNDCNNNSCPLQPCIGIRQFDTATHENSGDFSSPSRQVTENSNHNSCGASSASITPKASAKNGSTILLIHPHAFSSWMANSNPMSLGKADPNPKQVHIKFQSNNACVKIRMGWPIPTPRKADSYQSIHTWDGIQMFKTDCHWKAKFQSNVDCTSLGHAIQLQVAQPASPTSHLRSPTL